MRDSEVAANIRLTGDRIKALDATLARIGNLPISADEKTRMRAAILAARKDKAASLRK